MISIICGCILIYSHFTGVDIPLNLIGGLLIGSGVVDIARMYFP